MQSVRRLGCSIAVLVFAISSAASAQQGQNPAELATRIDRLIQQLDDDTFAVREKAQAALAEIGEPALDQLTAAAKSSSAERSKRAARVLAGLREAGLGLRYLTTVQSPGLQGAVTVALSPDGKFAYVPGFQAGAINAFRRDVASGALEPLPTLADPEQLGGVITVRLSPVSNLAVAAAYSSKSIALLKRNATTGLLSIESVRKNDPAGGLTLDWPINANFSTDGKFVYGLDDRAATVVVFRVEDGPRLSLVEIFAGAEKCFAGARGITAHPDGKTLYVSSRRPGTLSVLDRDPASGKLALRQVLRDGQDGITGLAGTNGTCVSRDGKFVYAISGRFEGANAIGVYRVGEDGKLNLLQEFLNDASDLTNFTGGNALTISPDGLHLYATGTRSCSLVSFKRDPVTGKLTHFATFQNEATGVGTGLGASGVEVSPDGRFLYLALEDGSAVSVFERILPKRAKP